MTGNTKFPSKTPIVFLLLSGLTSAGVVAFLAAPAEKPIEQSRPSSQAPSNALQPDPPADRETYARPAIRRNTPPLTEWTANSIPEMEEVRSARLPSMKARENIAQEGISAFLKGFSCEPPYTQVSDGMIGPGFVGCGVKTDEGRIVRLGKWVRRRPNGDFEVGRYEDGLQHGKWELFAPDGMIRERGYYEYGKRHGAWEQYSAEGKHEGHRMYHEGRYHGVTVLYNRLEPTIEVWQDGELVSTRSGFDEVAEETSAPISPGVPAHHGTQERDAREESRGG